MSAPAVRVREFWCSVRDQHIGDMQLFLSRFPDTVACWRDASSVFQFGQPVYANTGCNLQGTDFSRPEPPPHAPISAAVLFMHGWDFEAVHMAGILEAAFSVCGAVLAAPAQDKLMKRVELWMRKNVSRCEQAMVASARVGNLTTFRFALDQSGILKRSGVSLALDVSPLRVPDITVLQAVLKWDDVKIRRELLATLLPRCTLDYVLLTSVPDQDGCTTVFESAVLTKDADALQAILSEIVRHSALQEQRTQSQLRRALDMCHDALAAETHAADAYDAVLVKLCSHLTLEHLTAAGAAAAAAAAAAERALARAADDRSSPAYSQAHVARDACARALAIQASMVAHAKSAADLAILTCSTRTTEEARHFTDLFQAELRVLDSAHVAREQVALLRLRVQVLTDIVSKQALALQYVQHDGAAALSDASFGEFLASMDALETALFVARMPALDGLSVLDTSSPVAGATAGPTSLEDRYLTLTVPSLATETANLQAMQAQLSAVRVPLALLK